MKKQIIFQLGTNNWQRGDEFAPGSGILHEAHHHAFNRIPDTVGYSVYPSKNQTSDDPLVTVFPLEHDIPICESISPVSSYRFHNMSDEEFDAYKAKVMAFVESEIERIETREQAEIDLAIAHHTFVNPLVLVEINRKRRSQGRQAFKILCFAHGTALKMFAHEKAGIDPDYPRRFLDLMHNSGVFEGGSEITACAAISNDQLKHFADVFPNYPSERMLLSVNGCDTQVFCPDESLYGQRDNLLAAWPLASSPVASAPEKIDVQADHVVAFCGKFADWKRLDALLNAMKVVEAKRNVATLIIGSGPEDAVEHYHSLAYTTLGLKQTYFLGPLAHQEIAKINTIADVGVYPSRSEPFGLVFIECMACGTPVIGANSGGPRDFVTPEVGVLVPESEGQPLIDSLVTAIESALSEGWKQGKGPVAATYAKNNFSVVKQCADLLQGVAKCSDLPAATKRDDRQTG